MTSNSFLTTSSECKYAATNRRLCRSPFFARVIMRAAVRETSLARTTVVSIWPWVKSEVVRLRSIARRWSSLRPRRLPAFWWRIFPIVLRLWRAQGEAALGELLLDLVDRFLAEIAHVHDLVFCLLQQLGDLGDPGALQAVVRAYREVELVDRNVPVGERLSLFGGHLDLSTAAEVDEQRQLVLQDLGGGRKRLVGGDAAVGLDLEDQAVVVGRLADARVFDVIRDLADRREDRIDRDQPDDVLDVALLLCGDVAAPLLDADLHVQPRLLVRQRGDVILGIEQLDIRVGDDIGGGHFPLAARLDAQHFGLIGGELERQSFEVEDDVGDVLDHARYRRELVQHAIDLHVGDGRTRQR